MDEQIASKNALCRVWVITAAAAAGAAVVVGYGLEVCTGFKEAGCNE